MADKSDKANGHNKDSYAEFTQRVCRFLLICIEGLCRLIHKDEPLHAKLVELDHVVRKVIPHPQPPTELAREINDYFSKLHLEKEVQETQKEEVKFLIIKLTEALQALIGSTGTMEEDLSESIEKIQAADSIQDIVALKDEIVGHAQNIKNQTKQFREQLEKQTQMTRDLAEKVDQLRAGSLIDPLTNVLNRAAYTMKINQTLREFARYNDPLALIMADIDHFKSFNDQFGHKVGDRVLQSVAAAIQGSIRTSDLVFRYGGEEFVILLNKVNEKNALSLAEKIRAGVEKDKYVDGNQTLKITVSLGVTCCREGDTETSLFERADKAMFAAKKKGRNRVEEAL